MPDENDDKDHDVIVPTTTAAVATTSAAPDPEATKPHTKVQPSDHPERPTKNPVASPSSSPSPSSTKEKPTSGTEVAQEATSTASSSWVSWLPSFGASKKAQIWIYGAVGLIAAFCCGLGAYFWIARRRRLRNNPRNNYEFELIDEEEVEGLNNGEKNVVGKKGRRTRGGELYDAFAGGSDDDDEYDHYRDRAADRMAGETSDHYAVGGESDDDSDSDEREETRPLGGNRR